MNRWLPTVLLFLAFAGKAASLRLLSGNMPEVVKHMQSLGRLPATNELRLAIQLPLWDQAALTAFLQRLYDPASADYHKYLTPEGFTARFGPAEEDYQSVVRFAEAAGMKTTMRPSRLLLDVTGTVSDVEKAFHVVMRTYQHPAEARQFYAPDREPSVDARLPDLHIHGLTDYSRLRPFSRRAQGVAAAGSGPMGNYLGPDFTNAYLGGVSLNGAGQLIGLFEADGYYPSDIAAYERLAGLPNVPLTVVTNDGFTGAPGANNEEVAMDIEMAISMAPGLAGLVAFEGPDTVSDWIDILDSMASSNQIKQFSSSWGYTGSPDPNTNFDAVFQKMAAQGQTFLQASGDGDAWVNPIYVPADSPYVTSVGGTSLTMSNSGAVYVSESVWNSGDLGAGDAWGPNGNGWWGSGGGVSTIYSLPSWQQNISMAASGGSTNMRNIPDVSLVADDVWVIYNDGESNAFMGTSAAAPLWAGFIALANQQAAASGKASVGFINPALYAIGRSASYALCFNDITNGNNTNAQSHNLYPAVTGYDLCTGWGTPVGVELINALAPPDTLRIFPAAGFAASGGAGGPFTPVSQIYTLTNGGAAPLSWTATPAVPWLNVSPAGGALTNGGPAVTMTVSLNAAASNEVAGAYAGSVWFSNLTDGVAQSRAATLNVIPPPSFTLLPASETVFSGATATFTATATNGTILSYQWQQNGTNLTDGASISGSSTTALILYNVAAASTGSYAVAASNIAASVTSAPPAVLTVEPSPQLVVNGGFETGNFSGWSTSGNFGDGQTFVTTEPIFVHSGQYGAELGPAGSLGYLSQNLPTLPGQLYALSLWLDNPGAGSGTPNQFLVTWNGTTVFNQTNLPEMGWTNVQSTVTASQTNTVLEIGMRDDPSYLGLDDVSVLPLRATLQSVSQSGGAVNFSWIALPNGVYQIQSATNLAQTNWNDLGGPIAATNPILTATCSLNTNSQTFYRVVLAP